MRFAGKWQRLFLLAVVAAASVLPAPARAAADAGLVLEAIQVLDAEYVEQALVDRVRLLNAALEGITAALGTAGVPARFAVIAPGTAPAEAERIFRAAFAAALTAAAGKVSARELAYAAITALTASLNDSHTGFLTPEQYRERIARQRQQAGFAGVGMVLLPKDGRFYVWQVIPRSPAERLDVRPFDRIVRVNGTPTGGLTAEQVVSLIRGPAGSTVTVTFERPGHPVPLIRTIIRAPIVVPPLFAARMVEPRVAYVYLYEFTQGSGREMRAALQRLLGEGMRALVLDLRSNVGGFLHELREAVSLIVPRGLPIYQQVTSRGTEVVYTERSPVLPAGIPLVVLVNEGTASAAELLAAAVVEHQRGTLVGVKTAGAVEASTLFELSDGSALSVTIRRLASGKGRRLEGTGVTPDVVLDLTSEDFLRGRDVQLARAVEIARERVARPAAPPPAPVPTR